MMDTNALFAVAFSMIANFAGVMHLPLNIVPGKQADLQKCVVTRTSPLTMYLVHRTGTEFWIRDGSVARFSRPGSFFSAQDPGELPMFAGNARFGSNEVVQIAATVLKQLTKRGNPLTNVPPSVRYAGFYKGERIPFFQVSLPNPPGYGAGLAAQVEIDGRTGELVRLSLWDKAFFDPAFEEELERQVFKSGPAPLVPAAGEGPVYARPNTNEVRRAIVDWLTFCRKLSLDPGVQTNVADVDWSQSILYPDRMISETHLVTRVRFKNGTFFNSFQGVTFTHYAADAALTGNQVFREGLTIAQREAAVRGKWEPLVRELEERITTQLHIPRSMFTNSEPTLNAVTDDVQAVGKTRVSVWWRRLPSIPDANATAEYFRSLLRAEFDVDTKQIKSIDFNPKFIRNLRESSHEPPKPRWPSPSGRSLGMNIHPKLSDPSSVQP